MFGKKVHAKALILDDAGAGRVLHIDSRGVHWQHRKYILEVRPEDGARFRVETKSKVASFHAPMRGDLIHVAYDPKSHKTEIQIKGDPRYDPKLIRARKKHERAARTDALLSGAAVPAGTADEPGDLPRWDVPESCPQCGTRVDQSAAVVAEHPTCPHCNQPLPCTPLF